MAKGGKIMKRKIGVLSCSISIILLGVLLLLRSINISILTIYYNILGPLFLILLGIEIIFSKAIYKESSSGVNVGLILLTIIIMAISMSIFYFQPFFGGMIRFGDFFSNSMLTNEKIVNKEMDISDGINNVNIKNKMGSINFTGTDDKKIVVIAKIRYGNAVKNINNDSITLKYEGDTVYINDNINRNIDFYGSTFSNNDVDAYKRNQIDKNLRNNGVIIDYNIKVPKGKNIFVDNGFGLVECDGYNGKTNITNQFGSIYLRAIKNDANVKNKYGKINVENADGNVDVSNEFGEIAVNGAKSVNAKNKFGQINIDNVRNGSIYADNQFGSVYAKGIPHDAYIELSTKFGSISTNIPVNMQNDTVASKANGKIGSGKYTVFIRNSHGNINVNE